MADVPSTSADGTVKIVFVPTLADPTAPTVTEVTGASAKDLSCYLTADGWTPGLDEQTVSDDRLCSTQTFEKPGRAARSLTIKYVENPTDDPNNVAYVTLAPGTTGYLVQRRGVSVDTALATDDVVDVWPVQAGKYDPQPPEANSVLKVQQKMFVTGSVEQAVAVVAGA